jgi:urease accessory protein UreF
MFRLLQRMDDAPAPGSSGEGMRLPVTLTVLADPGETELEALENWASELDWVQMLFAGIRANMDHLYFTPLADADGQLYPRRNREAQAVHWNAFVESDVLRRLGHSLAEAWQAARANSLDALIRLDAELGSILPVEVQERSRNAGAHLLRRTQGARYPGLLGRYREICLNGQTPGHFLIAWALTGHFFQLSLAVVLAEYLRLEWRLAHRCEETSMPLEPLTQWTRQRMRDHFQAVQKEGITEPLLANVAGTHDSPP